MAARGIVLAGLALLWILPFVRIEPAPADVLVWLAGGSLLLLQPRSVWESLPRGARWGVVLLFLAHGSIAWAPDTFRAAWFTLATSEMFLFVVIFLHLRRTMGDGRGLAIAYIGGSVIAAVLGLLAYFSEIPGRELFLFGDGPARVRAWFKDPNVFGAYLVPAVILWWAWVSSRPTASRTWIAVEGGVAGVLTLGILLSGSRTAWGGLTLGLGLFLLLLVRRIGLRKLLRRGWGPAIGTALALATIVHPQVYSLVADRAALIKPYDYDRIATWRNSVNSSIPLPSAAPSNPWSSQDLASFARVLFGYGPGQSEVILQYATHNLYLRVLFELGILGAVGLVIFLLAVGRSLLSKQPFGKGALEGQALLASIAALLAMSLFIDSLHWRHLFVFFGIALAIGIPKVIPKEEKEQHEATLQVAGEKA